MATKREPDQIDTAGELINDPSVLRVLQMHLVEAVFEAEMADLGYEKHSPDGDHTGTSSMKILDGNREFDLDILRDRNETFKPQFGRGPGRWYCVAGFMLLNRVVAM